MSKRITRKPYAYTQEDADLLRATEEDIIADNSTFCFDPDEMKRRIDLPDRWQTVIQAHLYFEHIVDALLREAIPNPNAISIRNMGFAQRLSWTEALDLLPKAILDPIKATSSIRNDVAHDLNFVVSDEAVLKIRSAMPKVLKQHIAACASPEDDDPLCLKNLLEGLIFQVEVIRQGKAAERVMQKKSSLRLQWVLDGKPPLPDAQASKD